MDLPAQLFPAVWQLPSAPTRRSCTQRPRAQFAICNDQGQKRHEPLQRKLWLGVRCIHGQASPVLGEAIHFWPSMPKAAFQDSALFSA